MTRRWLKLGLLGCLCGLPGCAAGPDFVPPGVPPEAGYVSGSLPARTAAASVTLGTSQRVAPGADIPSAWWDLFRSRSLNAVIEEALARNPSIDAAEATLRAAVANARAQEGALFPLVTASFNASRNKTSGSLAPVPSANVNFFSLFTAQATMLYTLDIFGGVRRSIEAAQAQAGFSLYQLRAAQLTLTANVASTAVQEASLREQIKATEEIVRLQEETLRVLKLQNEKGQIAGLDVVAQETALAQAKLALHPLHKQLAQTRDLLAILTGNFPNSPPAAIFRLSDLRLPRDLPVSLPSELVEQRPDVMAAEALLHSASAQVGVAIANRLPSLTISANYGATSVAFDTLLAGSNRFWSVAGSAAQTVFDGGTLREKQKAAEAAYDSAAASYRAAVLTAFQNVADALKAIQYDALTLASAAQAQRSAEEYLGITKEKLQLGAANSLTLLSAQQAYQQTRITLIQAQAARLADTILLFQALGGGWWGRSEVPPAAAAASNAALR